MKLLLLIAFIMLLFWAKLLFDYIRLYFFYRKNDWNFDTEPEFQRVKIGGGLRLRSKFKNREEFMYAFPASLIFFFFMTLMAFVEAIYGR